MQFQNASIIFKFFDNFAHRVLFCKRNVRTIKNTGKLPGVSLLYCAGSLTAARLPPSDAGGGKTAGFDGERSCQA